MAIDTKLFVGADKFLNLLEEDVVGLQNNIADELVKELKEIVPVRTGTLRDGYEAIHTTSIGQNAEVINPVEYHDYVNDGTPFMAGHHMLERAIEAINKDASHYLPR